MPTVERVARTNAGLASELRLSVMRLRRRLATERHPDNELSLGSMSVLGCLLRRGELTVGELASHEKVRPPTMTRTIKYLEEGGYLTRRPDESDKRQVIVSLTPEGLAIVRADRARRDAWLAQALFDFTPEERDALRKAAPLLQRLAEKD